MIAFTARHGLAEGVFLLDNRLGNTFFSIHQHVDNMIETEYFADSSKRTCAPRRKRKIHGNALFLNMFQHFGGVLVFNVSHLPEYPGDAGVFLGIGYSGIQKSRVYLRLKACDVLFCGFNAESGLFMRSGIIGQKHDFENPKVGEYRAGER